jgi:hypothetical protein
MLSTLQKNRFKNSNRVKIINRSFMDLPLVDKRPCFVLAMEVWDNLAQDIIEYDSDGCLLEGLVVTNEDARYYDIPGKYSIEFENVKDELILKTVNVLDEIGFKSRSLRWSFKDCITFLGYQPMHRWQFIPTGIFQFLQTLKSRLPNARLLASDFDHLPDATPGHGGPVVQTRFQGDTVSCSTFLLKKGLFDIFFPIDFNIAKRMTESILSRPYEVIKHRDFLTRYGEIDKTRTISGYNPMLEEFENVSFLASL